MIRCKKLSPSSCEPTLIWAGNVVFGSNIVERGSVVISSDGRIESCHPRQGESEAKKMAAHKSVHFITIGSQAAMSPGMIDVHCHVSELGRDWEGYRSATRAAAAGGITTIMGMPLNSLPATTSKAAFQLELEAARQAPLMSDVGLWGGVVPDSLTDLDELLDCTGVFGIKAFLAPLPETAGYQAVPPDVLAAVAVKCGDRGVPVLVHSELMTQEEVDTSTTNAFSAGFDPPDAHLASRPAKWERDAIQVVCDLSDSCHMHIVHLSDAGSLDLIDKAKSRSTTSMSVETCPHYLTLNAETSRTTLTKCFPPIREEKNRLELWNGIQNGLIDMVASDHSPCTPDMRCIPMKEAWGGIAGLQYQLPATVSGMKSIGCTDREIISLMARLWSEQPAKLVPGFRTNKGQLEPGMQADLCIWDPGYHGPSLAKEHHRWCGASPFATMDLKGRIQATFLSGIKVYDGDTDTFLDDSKAPGSMWVRE